jgi:tight adherence protein B
LGRRRRVTLGLLLASVAVGLATPVASSAAPGLQVSEGAGATFPARSLVLSVPSVHSLQPTQVHVSENGKPVTGAVLRSISHAGEGDFGVVLAIDVSPSMHGQPLENAMSAARALAAQRVGQQQLGVLLFDQSSTTLLSLTTSQPAITKALARTPALGPGTHIYDALSSALGQLNASRVTAGAVILLSDGADRGSTSTEQAVAAAARAAHVALYAVGVRDATFNSSSLRMLAQDGGGSFLESSAADLRGLFTQLEAGLTNRYVIHYRSNAPLGGHHVSVSVGVDGIPQVGTVEYTSPPAPTSGAAHHKTKSFWTSTLALIIFACAVAQLLGLALFVLLATRLRRTGLRNRVGAFTASGVTEVLEHAGLSSSRILRSIERFLSGRKWWERFQSDVEISGIGREAIELVALAGIATIVASVLLGIALGTPVISLLVLVMGPLALNSVVKARLSKQRALFAEQLPTHLQELASTMRAGHSLVSGITSMVKSAAEPSRTEWARVVADEQLGMPLEEAMRPMARRMDSEDIGQVTLVAALHHRTGGNMAEVLERVADSVRERSELLRELRSLTAQARLSRWVVTALPPVVAGLVAVINPNYMRPLFETSTGVTLLLMAAGLIIAASLVMRAITNIKV